MLSIWVVIALRAVRGRPSYWPQGPRQSGKEDPAMTPAPAHPRPSVVKGANGWREIIQSGTESGGADGVSLEHLIDRQRALARRADDTA